MVECIFKATGKVIHGFGRGSKELGIPTANLDDTVVKAIPKLMMPGVYAGFAQVKDGPVYPMVMSLGWNPFYKNVKKSLEVHILNTFEKDFYDEQLSIVVLRYIRPERDFETLEKLIEEIQNDIAITVKLLQNPEYRNYAMDPIFKL
ncbi:unnamed protein product [Hymenolepis diminuta]|uniref:riboflavin kinase n=1 Tax=Hymenolepis diminuta TaxID=6216 RepID=A0A0R3SCC0_HYMDI|nr:unnamed protein product [Hymenolepis diminuta]VUZ50962.1 unnamed protein product [Hymenolepis diminuta]